MRLRFFAVSLLLAFLLFTGTAFSQTFTGLFDGNYAYNFNKPANQNNQFTNGVPSRAFDINHNMFSLNYAEIAVEQKPSPVGYRFDFGFGDTARVVNASEPSSADLQHIQQAFASVKKDNMTVDFGKFVTPLGAEVIETKDNWNYSRSIAVHLRDSVLSLRCANNVCGIGQGDFRCLCREWLEQRQG